MARPNCPRCGSDLVAVAVADSPSEWVEELRGGNLRAHPLAERDVNWLCRACGHRWVPPDADGALADVAAEQGSNEPSASPVREYAELLRLQPDRSAGASTRAARSPAIEPLAQRPGRRDLVGAALVVIAVAAVVVIALLPQGSAPDVEVPRPSSALVDGNDEGDPPPAPARQPRGVRAVLHVRDDCWVRAIADGEVVASITLAPGETVVYRADRDLELTLGNAGGVKLRVGGQPVATGGAGDVVVLDITWRRGEVRIERAEAPS